MTNSKLANGAVTASKLNANLLADPNVVWVSTDGSASGDGTMKSPYGSLYDAVISANSGKTIVVMPGTYNFTNEILLDGSFSNMTIMGLSDNPADTLLNSTDDTERIFIVNGGTNITIMNFDFTSTDNGNGGAVYLNSGTIKNCSFNNCDALFGGGVFAFDSGTVSDCEFNNCDAGGRGGGVYTYNNSTVSGCKFSDCDATTGGGVFAGLNSKIKFCDIPRGDCPGKINSVYLTSGAYIQASIWDDDGDAGDFVVYDNVGNDTCP